MGHAEETSLSYPISSAARPSARTLAPSFTASMNLEWQQLPHGKLKMLF